MQTNKYGKQKDTKLKKLKKNLKESFHFKKPQIIRSV